MSSTDLKLILQYGRWEKSITSVTDHLADDTTAVDAVRNTLDEPPNTVATPLQMPS